MITLEGETALEYLSDLRSTIHPDDKFPQAELLNSLVGLRIIALRRSLASSTVQDEFNQIQIAENGFPDLLPWWLQAIMSFSKPTEEVTKSEDNTEAFRARQLLPLIQDFINVRPRREFVSTKGAKEYVQPDAEVLKAVKGAFAEKENLLKAANASYPNSFPITVDPQKPELLLILKPDCEKFSHSLKFIEKSADKNYPRSPMLLYFWRNLEHVLVCTPGKPSDKWWKEMELPKEEKATNKLINLSLSGSFISLLAGTDFTRMSDRQINGFLKGLSEGQELANDTSRYLDSLVTDIDSSLLKNEIFSKLIKLIENAARRMGRLYKMLEEPYRTGLQEAVRDRMEPYRKKINDIAYPYVSAPAIPVNKIGIRGFFQR